MTARIYPRPDWSALGPGWPNAPLSRFVEAGGLRWRLEEAGSGPTILLLHGTGAGAHSFRDVLPRLAGRGRVLAPDLPGHAFTSAPTGEGLSLEGMAGGLRRLLEVAGAPDLIVGHSAGAALALRLALDGLRPRFGVVGINAALEPFPGSSGALFPLLANALFLNPLAVGLFAARGAQPQAVRRLIESTGSRIDARGIDCYRALFGSPGHIAGALGMMANWKLEPLRRAVGRIEVPLTLIAAEGDRAVPPRVSEAVAREAPGARLVRLPWLGHLAHEEDPAAAADLILAAADLAGGAP